MQCPNCGNEQASGKFCGKCGTSLLGEALTEKNAHTDSVETPIQKQLDSEQQQTVQINSEGQHTTDSINTTVSSPSQPAAGQPEGAAQSVHVDKVKETSKQFWNYSLQYIKNPVRIFNTQTNQLINGLIAIGIFAFLIALIPVIAINHFTRSQFGGFGDMIMENAAPSLFTAFLTLLIFSLISVAIVIFSLFIVSKFFGPSYSFKEITSHFGSHLIPSLVLLLASLLLVFLKSFVVGILLFAIAATITLSIIPLYLIGRYLTTHSKVLDPFYGYIAYILVFGILSAIFATILTDSAASQIIDQFDQLLY